MYIYIYVYIYIHKIYIYIIVLLYDIYSIYDETTQSHGHHHFWAAWIPLHSLGLPAVPFKWSSKVCTAEGSILKVSFRTPAMWKNGMKIFNEDYPVEE